MAFVIAIHEIEDSDGFWRLTATSASLPEVRLRCIYPLVNGAKAVSLWEGASADSVGDVVDPLVGGANRTEFYEVDALSAFGLPDAVCQRRSSAEVEKRRRRIV